MTGKPFTFTLYFTVKYFAFSGSDHASVHALFSHASTAAAVHSFVICFCSVDRSCRRRIQRRAVSQSPCGATRYWLLSSSAVHGRWRWDSSRDGAIVIQQLADPRFMLLKIITGSRWILSDMRMKVHVFIFFFFCACILFSFFWTQYNPHVHTYTHPYKIMNTISRWQNNVSTMIIFSLIFNN